MASEDLDGSSGTVYSTPVELPFGEGGIAVSSASTLTSAVQITIGDDIWVADKDETAPDANKMYAVDAGCPCWVRLEVSAGTCTLQVVPQAREKYK